MPLGLVASHQQSLLGPQILFRTFSSSFCSLTEIPHTSLKWCFLFFFFSPTVFRGEGNGNPLQCSCLENPRDGGAWWAAVSGVAQSWTRLKQLSRSSSNYLQILGWEVGKVAWLLTVAYRALLSPLLEVIRAPNAQAMGLSHVPPLPLHHPLSSSSVISLTPGFQSFHHHFCHSFCVLCAKSLELCPTLCGPMDHSPPGSSVNGIPQARILEWVAMSSSRESS